MIGSAFLAAALKEWSCSSPGQRFLCNLLTDHASKSLAPSLIEKFIETLHESVVSQLGGGDGFIDLDRLIDSACEMDDLLLRGPEHPTSSSRFYVHICAARKIARYSYLNLARAGVSTGGRLSFDRTLDFLIRTGDFQRYLNADEYLRGAKAMVWITTDAEFQRILDRRRSSPARSRTLADEVRDAFGLAHHVDGRLVALFFALPARMPLRKPTSLDAGASLVFVATNHSTGHAIDLSRNGPGVAEFVVPPLQLGFAQGADPLGNISRAPPSIRWADLPNTFEISNDQIASLVAFIDKGKVT